MGQLKAKITAKELDKQFTAHSNKLFALEQKLDKEVRALVDILWDATPNQLIQKLTVTRIKKLAELRKTVDDQFTFNNKLYNRLITLEEAEALND